MSNFVLTLNRICLRCGDVTAKNVRCINLSGDGRIKERGDKRLIYYLLCTDCQAATLDEILYALEQYPDRWQATGIRGLQVDNPVLTNPNFISFRI